jgi:hypothetical protein
MVGGADVGLAGRIVQAARMPGLTVLGWVLLAQLPVLVGGYGPVLGAGVTVGVVVAVAAVAAVVLSCGVVVTGPAAGLGAGVAHSAGPAAPVRQADPAAAGRPHPRAPGRRGTTGAV